MPSPDPADADRREAYAALDIETDGLEGATDTLVAIGLGYADTTGDCAVAVHTLADAAGDEVTLMERAADWLDRRQPATLVTYNGTTFDLPFLEARADALRAPAALRLPANHHDLFTDRQRRADRAGEKWPSLAESLRDAGLPVPITEWDGRALTNQRFAAALAPRYLRALDGMEFHLVRALEPVIRDYTRADIRATMALYEADTGWTDTVTTPG